MDQEIPVKQSLSNEQLVNYEKILLSAKRLTASVTVAHMLALIKEVKEWRELYTSND